MEIHVLLNKFTFKDYYNKASEEISKAEVA